MKELRTLRSVRLILLGGAPGAGKSETARELLVIAQAGDDLVQWVDVDTLWLHQPWRVDHAMINMLHANLAAVLANADHAGVTTLILTWVYQDTSYHRLVLNLAANHTRRQPPSSWSSRRRSGDTVSQPTRRGRRSPSSSKTVTARRRQLLSTTPSTSPTSLQTTPPSASLNSPASANRRLHSGRYRPSLERPVDRRDLTQR